MKVICIHDSSFSLKNASISLTKGKAYEVIAFTSSLYQIINERGFIFTFPKDWFLTIEEQRDKRLKEIGI
jgi:ABC-type uncharacterized transport system involved in gliding motility auxiliary subunit